MTSILASCAQIGTTRVKNLIDLTPGLEVNDTRSNAFIKTNENPIRFTGLSSYTISKESIASKPTIAKQIIYNTDSKGYVTAFSLTDRKKLWTAPTEQNKYSTTLHGGGILFNNDKLYITNGTRDLIVLNAASGIEIMRKEFPDILRTKPVITQGHILILQTVSNLLIAYDLNTSTIIWTDEGSIETISLKNYVTPVIHDNHVLVSYTSGDLAYVDIKTGKEKWSYQITKNAYSIGLPSLETSVLSTDPITHGGFAYFATSTGSLTKLDLNTGKEVWKIDAEDVQSVAKHQDYLLITNNARQFGIIDANNGQILFVGNLISKKERASKRPKVVFFQKPFINKENDAISINVVSSNGELYQFITQDGNIANLPIWPNIVKITSGVKYSEVSCCSDAINLITNRKIFF